MRVIRVARAMRLSGAFFTAPPRRVFVCISETLSPYTDCVCHPFWQRPSDARRTGNHPPATLTKREREKNSRVFIVARRARKVRARFSHLCARSSDTKLRRLFARFLFPRTRIAFRTRNVTVAAASGLARRIWHCKFMNSADCRMMAKSVCGSCGTWRRNYQFRRILFVFK